MSTHGSRHQPHPGETGSGLALRAVSSQHSSAQAGGAQTVLGGAASVRLKAGVSTRAPGHRHPRCLEPSTGPGALAGRGLCSPGESVGAWTCQLQPALGTTRRFVPRRFSESRGRGEWENHTEGLQDPSAPRRSLICNRDRPPYREQTDVFHSINETEQSFRLIKSISYKNIKH